MKGKGVFVKVESRRVWRMLHFSMPIALVKFNMPPYNIDEPL